MCYSIESGRMIITDTSYDIQGYDQVIIDNVQPGNWYDYLQPWIDGVILTSFAEDCPDEIFPEKNIRLGVISGQIGIFDYNNYQNYLDNVSNNSAFCTKILNICETKFGTIVPSFSTSDIFNTTIWRSSNGNTVGIYIYFGES